MERSVIDTLGAKTGIVLLLFLLIFAMAYIKYTYTIFASQLSAPIGRIFFSTRVCSCVLSEE